jgi:hypothetical protein
MGRMERHANPDAARARRYGAAGRRERLGRLRDVSRALAELAGRPEPCELDADAVVDLNLARQSVDKPIHRDP